MNISNNTVVNLSGNPADRPWILLHDHKNGEPSTDAIVANNLTMKLSTSAASANYTNHIDNSIIFYPASSFKDVLSYDYTPVADSGFIDTANAAYAPDSDIFGGLRPFGAGPDRGAIEVGALPSDATDSTDSVTGGTSGVSESTSTEPDTESTSLDGETDTVDPAYGSATASGGGNGQRLVGRWLKAPKGLNKK